MARMYTLPVKQGATRWIVDEHTPRTADAVVITLLNQESSSSGSEERNTSPGLLKQLQGLVSRTAPVRKTPPARGKAVLVIAPGAGVGANGQVYMALKKDASLRLQVFGRSRMPYDRYPQAFPQGAPAPNLESFSRDVLAKGAIDSTDCLVVGSRGGQVVLPNLWSMKGDTIPPAVVINGGCAMDLPFQVEWPRKAVSLLLLGGRDYFKPQHLSPQQYVADAQSRVPKTNSSTAILFVNEMEHMPSSSLLSCVLRDAIIAVTMWKESGMVPVTALQSILTALRRGGWTARLTYTRSNGLWEEISCTQDATASPAQLSPWSTPVDKSPLGGTPFALSAVDMAKKATEQTALQFSSQVKAKQVMPAGGRTLHLAPVLLAARQAEGAKRLSRQIHGGAVKLLNGAAWRSTQRSL